MSEHIELTDQDQADLAQLYNEPSAEEAPPFHTVLEAWQKVLTDGQARKDDKPSPTWASTMISAYHELRFHDMIQLRDRYFAKLVEIVAILNDEIVDDPLALTYTSAEEDRTENAQHYRNVLTNWQLRFRQWEMQWDCSDTLAAVELAAIGEVYKILFGELGMVAWLDQIQFEFTDDDRDNLAVALDEYTASFKEG